MQCSNNLKQIGLALHNYHSSKNCFPPGDMEGPNATPGSATGTQLGAFFMLLPDLELGNLYDQVNWNNPPANIAIDPPTWWDDPKNQRGHRHAAAGAGLPERHGAAYGRRSPYPCRSAIPGVCRPWAATR